MIKISKLKIIFFTITFYCISTQINSCDNHQKLLQIRTQEDFEQFLCKQNARHFIEQSNIISKIYGYNRSEMSYLEASLAIACGMVPYYRSRYPQYFSGNKTYKEYNQINQYISELNNWLTYHVFVPQKKK